MVAAPWDSVPPEEQLFVLITGANSGIGLGIGQRLIDEFLATRSLSAHLILIPTTRSSSKSLLAIQALREYATTAAQTSKSLLSRTAGGGSDVDYRWQDTVARIHVLSPSLDLCDLRGVYAFAEKLCTEPVSNPEGLEGEYLRDVRIPRLDSVVFNAAYGGWTGCNYPLAIWSFFTQGLIQIATWPSFKNALPTCILNVRSVYNYPDKPLLGEVFAACVFGHYILAHQLLPLLSRRSGDNLAPGRIIWTSSIEAIHEVLDPDDMQCFLRPIAYESAKRLTDVISLTHSLPAALPFSKPFLQLDSESGGNTKDKPIPPKMYLSHPGVVFSNLFPLPWFFHWAYKLVLVLCRYFGSPWHNVDGYRGANAPAWIVLQDQATLDAQAADRIKWGSSCGSDLRTYVKKSEVEGWGWEGKPETDETIAADTSEGILHKSVGRKLGTKNASEEDVAAFEELGAKCWQEMERLRHQWAEILDQDGKKEK